MSTPTTKEDSLTIPGKTVYLTTLLVMKKFRNEGNKDGAVLAFEQLEQEGWGKMVAVEGSKGVTSVSKYCFHCTF